MVISMKGDNNDDGATWECARCEWILEGRPGEEVKEHGRQCPFRDTGKDPKPSELR